MNAATEVTLEQRLAREPSWLTRPAFQAFSRRLPIVLLLATLCALYGYFLAHPIDLTTADLGRHLKNGEILFSDSSVLQRNFYSYTHPDFPVVNHHWGSGLLFFLVWKAFGFLGMHLFFIALSLAALGVFLLSAKRYAGWGIAGLSALIAIPLLGERTEIRPEVFSYLFSGLFFLILSRYREDALIATESAYEHKHFLTPPGLLWFLPFLEILWVNTHLYFLLGPLLIGAFLLESVFIFRGRFFKLFLVFCATLLATLLNPFGLRAVTTAFNFFGNFGYRLAENQTVWFLEKLGMQNPNFTIVKVVLTLLALSFVAAVVRDCRLRIARLSENRLSSSFQRKLESRKDEGKLDSHFHGNDNETRSLPVYRPAHFFVAFGIGTLALLAVRNFALFGLFSIPLIAANFSWFAKEEAQKRLLQFSLGISLSVLFFFILFAVPRHFPYWERFGFGVRQGNDASATFLTEQKVAGPYFNNYDIGGYLIFHLFPRERVFVDNRPEAYPASFFTDEYIPMQESEEAWQGTLSRYDFNAIVFSHRDATPWGQKFLRTRIADKRWAPVFADSKALVLLRRTGENEATIRKFELPREMFRTAD